MTRRERIRKERAALGLRPWEFAPSEVSEGPNPYSANSVGHQSWARAQQMRRELAEAKRKQRAARQGASK